MKLVICSLLVLALPFAVARADHSRHRPPQAAFDACARSKAGDACSVTLGDRTITGLCATARDTTALVCRPDHPPGPPQEAVDACNGRSAGDACTVTHGDHSLSGTCAAGPDGNGPLACRPARPPRDR
jgi:hypothetical protein